MDHLLDLHPVTKQLFLTYNNKGLNPGSEVSQEPSTGDGDQEIWVLLTRHLADTHRTEDFIALRVQLEDHIKGALSISQQAHCVKVCTYRILR